MRFLKKAFIVILMLTIILSTGYNIGIPANALAYSAKMAQGDLISGIVRENNPSLGYITLYFQDGSGVDAYSTLTSLRTFTYGFEIPVLRDGITVTAESIQPGDQVFINLDADGYIQKLSAKSYYRPVYGTVHLKSAAWLILKKEDGSFVNYPISNSLPVYKNGRLGSLSDILPGDRVKLLVQTDDAKLHIASIDVEKVTRPITGLYRGSVEFLDSMQDTLTVSGVQEFVNGRWENSSFIGIQSFTFSSDYKIRPSRRVSGTVYFATRKSNDGENKIVVASYRGSPQYEAITKDNLINIADGGRLELENSSDIISFDKDTIAIKDGRLVDMSALNTLDPVKLAMEKTYAGSYRANVLVSDSITENASTIYRGRIKNIVPTKSITLESFAQLNGVTWAFTNTPKTLDIDLTTSRLIEDAGVGNMREFGLDAVGKSVYIVADGNKIKLISTAPYADSAASGRILSLTGGTYDSIGNVLTDPTGLRLTEAMVYDSTNHVWKANSNLDMSVPKHAMVIKKGKIGTASLLKPGDQIKIMRHSQSLNGILILCD